MAIDKDDLDAIRKAVREELREIEGEKGMSGAELLRRAYASPEHSDPAATRERITRSKKGRSK
jgi:hypothetical protein